MNQQKDKEFFKLTFKDMDQITKTIESALKINDDGLKDLEKMNSRDIEKKLFPHLNGSFDKVWNQKHCASDFSAGYGADEFRQLIKVDKLSDMFQFEQSTPHDMEVQRRANGGEVPEETPEEKQAFADAAENSVW